VANLAQTRTETEPQFKIMELKAHELSGHPAGPNSFRRRTGTTGRFNGCFPHVVDLAGTSCRLASPLAPTAPITCS
jgi:hypothetical protein